MCLACTLGIAKTTCSSFVLQVVIRNTVPFLTAICERVALKKPLDMMLMIALLITFVGTVLYSEAWLQLSSKLERDLYKCTECLLSFCLIPILSFDL